MVSYYSIHVLGMTLLGQNGNAKLPMLSIMRGIGHWKFVLAQKYGQSTVRCVPNHFVAARADHGAVPTDFAK